jgi:hypothetical protein
MIDLPNEKPSRLALAVALSIALSPPSDTEPNCAVERVRQRMAAAVARDRSRGKAHRGRGDGGLQRRQRGIVAETGARARKGETCCAQGRAAHDIAAGTWDVCVGGGGVDWAHAPNRVL